MVKVRPERLNKFRRDSWLEINLANLEFNLQKIYEWVEKPLIPVLKADAYGHGASVLVKVLDAYDFVHAYGVASVDEALSLRDSSKKDIIVLGICPVWAFEAALQNNVELSIVDYDSAVKLNELAGNVKTKAHIHIKIDTGLNRIGFKTHDLDSLCRTLLEIKQMPNLKIKSIFSHFADPNDKNMCDQQMSLFDRVFNKANLDCKRHMASSKVAREIPKSRYDYVRCGIELYGLENTDLKPLLSLFARISFIKDIREDEAVSYQKTWKADKDTRIATLPLGYADGLPRALSNKMQGFVNGKFVKQVGLITMDQLMLDLGPASNPVKVGDIVELIGPHIAVEDLAAKANTISYELVCALSLRLPKVYTR